jgi:hypothetical protein
MSVDAARSLPGSVDPGHHLHLSPDVVELVVADRPGTCLGWEQEPGLDAGMASPRQVVPVPADELERPRFQRDQVPRGITVARLADRPAEHRRAGAGVAVLHLAAAYATAATSS